MRAGSGLEINIHLINNPRPLPSNGHARVQFETNRLPIGINQTPRAIQIYTLDCVVFSTILVCAAKHSAYSANKIN